MELRHRLYIALFFYAFQAHAQKLTLFTMLYNEQNKNRINEFIYCLKKNMSNKSIETIHVFYDTSTDVKKNKIIYNFLTTNKISITPITGRTSFQYLFNFANQYYPNNSIIISNADIHFDETLKLLESYDLSNTFISLTRWEVEKNKPPHILHKHGFSHDVWIFNTPIPVKGANILLGVFGVDGALPPIIARYNLKQINPALDIKSYHIHESQIRHIPPFNYFNMTQMGVDITNLIN